MSEIESKRKKFIDNIEKEIAHDYDISIYELRADSIVDIREIIEICLKKGVEMARKECLENDIHWLRTILKMDKNNFKGMLEAQLKLLEKELKQSLEENK